MKAVWGAAVFSLVSILVAFPAVMAAPPNTLFDAVASKDLDLMVYLVEGGADPNARNSAGRTPLIMAAKQSRSEKLIEQLVFLGADIRARDANGMTALMHAAASEEQDNAELLLHHGSDPDIRDNNGKTVLDHAIAGDLMRANGNRPSFVSMLAGQNHKDPSNPPYAFYVPYPPGAFTPAEFEKAAIRALTRKGWGITEVSGSRVRAFYARPKLGRLYKVEAVVETNRIAIRFRKGFGFRDDLAYLEGIRFGLMHELSLY